MNPTPWDYVPTMPLTFMRGDYYVNADGPPRTFEAQYDLSIERAVVLLSFELPALANRWATVSDHRDRHVLTFSRRNDTTFWAGCKVGFDELTKWWPEDEVAWASTVAQNSELWELTGE